MNTTKTYKMIIDAYKKQTELQRELYKIGKALQALSHQIPYDEIREDVYVTGGDKQYRLDFDIETGDIIRVTEIELITLDTN